MSALVSEVREHLLDEQGKPVKLSKLTVEEENLSIMSAAEALRWELDDLHSRFNEAIEPLLIDSIIYEIQSVQLKYMYYLDMCKKKGLISEKMSRLKHYNVD
ncbi:MAG: DUF2508 family protein [Defluviitaleaceae bacterium]|nr:DUF2508 family protein [Defluviitaleaceae bacterium]